MYSFKLGGVECQCETAEELRAACLNGSAKATNGSANHATTEGSTALSPEIAALPLVQLPIHHKTLEKIAKQLGRRDRETLKDQLMIRANASVA